MTDLEKAARMALEALNGSQHRMKDYDYQAMETTIAANNDAITALRQALSDSVEQSAQQQEPVTVLPDGSAFAVMSYPLPKNHWLYADRQYNDGEYEPVELGKPILTHELSDVVVSAVRYAIRGATNCGKEVDFDPDALVQNAVYALCGPFTSPQPAQQQEPVYYQWRRKNMDWDTNLIFNYQVEATTDDSEVRNLYTSPQRKPWVGLTEEDYVAINSSCLTKLQAAASTEAILKEKNT